MCEERDGLLGSMTSCLIRDGCIGVCIACRFGGGSNGMIQPCAVVLRLIPGELMMVWGGNLIDCRFGGRIGVVWACAIC